MSAHASHRMHANSVDAYLTGIEHFGERARAVFEWVRVHGPSTDRNVMAGLGYTDPNATRPRISELVEAGILIEVGNVRDAVTGKTVRMVDVRRGPVQMGMVL